MKLKIALILSFVTLVGCNQKTKFADAEISGTPDSKVELPSLPEGSSPDVVEEPASPDDISVGNTETVPVSEIEANPEIADDYECQSSVQHSCQGGSKKILVCHVPNSSSQHNICISKHALSAHLDHHSDYLGVCK